MDHLGINKLCHFLAMKNDPELVDYSEECWLDITDDGDYKCLICNKIIAHEYLPDVFDEHGIAHLREKNLLPFI